MKDISVIQAKRYGICSCSSSTTLLEAAVNIVQDDISCLVVLDDEGCLAGIITRSDIVIASLQVQAWQSVEVDRFMSKEVVTVSPHDNLDHVAQLLIENHIHRVVIVETDNGVSRPLGVLSDADLLYHMVKQFD